MCGALQPRMMIPPSLDQEIPEQFLIVSGVQDGWADLFCAIRVLYEKGRPASPPCSCANSGDHLDKRWLEDRKADNYVPIVSCGPFSRQYPRLLVSK